MRLSVLCGASGLYGARLVMFALVKCFQEHIFLAAAGVAAMFIGVSAGSVHSVSLWQWSGLSWEIMIKSGFGSSLSDCIHGDDV